jgi:hypothetical protein
MVYRTNPVNRTHTLVKTIYVAILINFKFIRILNRSQRPA